MNKCPETILRNIGLSEGEIKVYVALLRLGLVTVKPIIKHTSLQSSSIYHILDSLTEKGIISHQLKNKRRYFYAINPDQLLEYIDEKQNKIEQERNEIQTIIPALAQIKQIKKPDQQVLIFEGWRGVLNAFKEAYKQIKPGTIAYAYTITQHFGGADPKQVRWLINKVRQMRDNLNKRNSKKIIMKVIAEKNSQIGLDQAKTKLTKVKFIDKHYTNPAVINIYGDITIIALWLQKPLAFYIISKEVADSFRNNFELLWNICL